MQGEGGAQFGAFGKMPSLGDFFRLRVAQDFVTIWDSWVQAALLSSRQLLGDRYDDCYMTAPVWRFVLPPGLAGTTGVMGVLMPSVDRVGRQFPLTLVGPSSAVSPLHDLAHQSPVLDLLEALALAALGDDMTREGLSDALAALAPLPPVATGRTFNAEGGFALVDSSPDAALADLTLGLGPGQLGTTAAWSTQVDGQSRIGLWPKLPTGAGAAALFDMDAIFWSGRTEMDFDLFEEIGIGQG
jgi:type VI secretion system protein ImpM